jgi:hypothetical protein
MFELPLHTGTEHADLTWIVLSGLAAFVAGIGLGIYNGRLRAFVRAAVSERP